MDLSQVPWRMRHEPLVPQGLMAYGAQRRATAERLLAQDDQRLARLRGIAGDHHLLILGNETDLPWIPEATYLGQDPLATHLMLPTNLTPDIPLEWLDRAIITTHGERHYAVDPMHRMLVPITDALSLDRSCLQQEWG
ncbi:MAG: hypothetical protein PVI97_16365 [Candidatus Thiodiazotropha sp.]